MAVYLDNSRNRYGRMVMCHMTADTLPELHAMANRIGMQRSWFQAWPRPHYDVCLERRRKAVEAGARVVDPWEFMVVIRRLRLSLAREEVAHARAR